MAVGNSFASFFNEVTSGFSSKSKKPRNFDEYKQKIEKTKKDIEAKREAFYAKNSDIKRRW